MFLNFYFIYAAFFVLVVIMYFLKLSVLYNISTFFYFFLVSLMFIVICIGLIFNKLSLKYFRILNYIIYKTDIFLCFNSRKKVKKVAFLFFFIGTLSALYIYKEAGLLIFKENKVSYNFFSPVLHYMNYFRNFLGYSIPLFFFLYKCSSRIMKKAFYIIIIILSFTLLSLSLRRGELTFPLLGILFIEYLFAVRRKKKKEFFLKFSIFTVIYIFLFNLFGNLRVEYVMNNIYKTSIQEFYGMNENLPSWFVWIYIYITSPLENFRHMIENQKINNHSFGLLMFYPFFQVLFKVMDSNLSFYRQQLYPYLDDIAGLNVSTFMQDAIIDFSYIGIYIYLLTFFLLLFISLKRSYKNIFGFLSYIMALNISLWSMFTNSLAIGPYIIGFLIFYILSFSMKKVK